MVDQPDTSVDDQVLALRNEGKGFPTIAKAVGLERAADANEAFHRALDRRPPAEQVTMRAQERARLERMAESVRSRDGLSSDDVDRRLRAIERLQARLGTA